MPATPPASPREATPQPPAAVTFEAAMERLEIIVEQMENARLPLEELIGFYEEGTRLIKVCSERLSAAEQRIEIITRDAAGQARVSEYLPPGGGAAGAPAAVPPVKATQEAKASSPPSPPAAPLNRPSKTPNEVSLF